MDLTSPVVFVDDNESLIDVLWAAGTQAVSQPSSESPSEETKPFTALSVYKQQLIYHNRLPVKIKKQAVATAKAPKQFIAVAEVVLNEPALESRKNSLNTLANNLIGAIGKTFEGVKSSSWVLKTESEFYILNPLHLAIKHGLFDCAKLLLLEGIDAKALDYVGRPPLHVVALLDDQELQQKFTAILLFYGACIDAPNKSGDTALTIAVQQEKDTLVDTLLDRGADPNINVQAEESDQKNIHASGTSPLWAAVSCNKVVPIALLLRKKAQMKSVERKAAQQMHDTIQDDSHKLLLAKVLATHHH